MQLIKHRTLSFHNPEDSPIKCVIVMAEKQDIPMNQFQTVTDVAYIYAESSNGSQVKIKKSDLVNIMNTLIGGIFPKLYPTPFIDKVKGFIVKTKISVAQYCAIRLQCSIGFNQNHMGNENFSVNIKFWDNNFSNGDLSKENYFLSICSYVICYVDDDNTFSFYINSMRDNHSGGYLMLYAISNVAGNANQIISMKAVAAEYVVGSCQGKENFHFISLY